MSAKLLVVEDERDIRDMLVFALEEAGFTVEEASTAERALSLLQDGFVPDMLLIDWMLPGANGVELARRVRQKTEFEQTPIIMLTARGEEDDRVKGLEAGADDYVVKPFSPRELIARIRAVLRRSGHTVAPDEMIEIGPLRMDLASHRVSVKNETLKLGPTEYRLLQFFMEHPERVFSRAQLLDAVWGHQVVVEERTVDVHMRRLRKALEPAGVQDFVQTVRGSGYRFSDKP
ncbi:phosphate regulon transcriptional regulator PhoB [Permianibacter aggregans]|uniref:Phosphate regulon transcriptional regulatory protein PhoB n=1 Tax=Permianibacter aggregans TaxID=1510150 RepID=A0A4R6UQ40_9GAMM|nr:phosphate regulon transcriptional regulator PhoB [Permianibacter aggregans]QGX40875.1 phosphate regulon transcriptional regulatory protein PhoB [Permianibacter aggregans]TDQ48306.1 winged helix family two component transcriptional regulator [Permianibacter aggregans]